MIKINLLPGKAAAPVQRVLNQIIFGLLVVLLTVAGLGWRYFSQQDRIAKVEQEIKDTNKQIAQLQEAKKKYEELLKKDRILTKQFQAINKLDKGRDWFIRVLDKVSESVPRGQLWIDSISYGGGRGANSITVKGRAYDRDAVALYMGNLSIVACDDELAEEEKADICRERNERCRKWNEEEKNWEWDFDGCRRFYGKVCNESRTCSEDVKACRVTQRTKCQENPQGQECRDTKAKCDRMNRECAQRQEDCKKLLEKQFIKYNSVTLRFVNLLSEDRRTGIPIYNYELAMEATEAPVE